MNKFVFWFLTVVIVLARCSAESIPAINKTSGFAVAHSSQAVERTKEAPHEEREFFAIDSFISSVKAADESLPGTIHAVNMVDLPQMKERLAIHEVNMMNVPQIKERNEVLATRMETLGIDIDGVVFVTKALESAIKGFSLNDLEWMVLGKVYFEKDESSSGHRIMSSKQLFQELDMEITNYEEIKKWTRTLSHLNVGARIVFGKMFWLIEHHNQLNLHLADAAKMAFGSEYLKIKKLPSSEKILEAVGKYNVDRDLVESIVRQDKDSKAPLVLGPFAIESFTSSGKTADESLPRTEHAATMMDVSEIKERNQVLATRMETLGIDIGAVVFVTEAIESVFERYYSLNDLEWMVLGKVYFEKDESSTGHKVVTSKQLFQELNMENIDYEEIKKWALRLRNLKVSAKVVFGKMLWLIEHHNQLNLHLADAAKMAFGSEYLKIIKLPSSGKILEAVGTHNVDRDLVESIVRQDKDSRKRKAPLVLGPFAIESFTSSVKTADEYFPRTEHAATMMDVSEIKERNQVLATQMEKLGIDIGGVVFVTEALKSKFERYFSRNNLGWMILGKVYFKKAESTTGSRRLFSKDFFKKLNMEIINYEEIKKWRARIYSFNVAVEKVFGKILWLLQHQNELNLDLADAAKMAFGSEYLEKIKLQISDEIRQAVAERNIDNDLVASIFGQDKPTDRGPFAIESLTSSVKTAGEPLPRTEHAATIMDVSEIKERNQVLATQMEKLGIDIGGVVFVTEALESQFESIFSRNNLGWMVLGKVYFKKTGSSTGFRRLFSKEFFKKLNMEIINYKEIKKWTARIYSFNVAVEKVFGKMFWLLHQQNELKLDLADAAKMAFGSEYLETGELPFSDDLLQAVTEHNVDKDVTASLIPQDKDSTMTDIAVDKLLETIRNYFGEEVHEQPNKKRKLA